MRSSKNGQSHSDKAMPGLMGRAQSFTNGVRRKAINRAAIIHQWGGVAFLEKSYSPAGRGDALSVIDRIRVLLGIFVY